jgi:Neuraminidase (sialidase)
MLENIVGRSFFYRRLLLSPTGTFSMKSGTPYMIVPFAPPSNTLKDTKTAITPTIASRSLLNSTWTQIPQQENSNHSMAAIGALTFPFFYPMLVPNSK